jgi:subtilisin family serine protease
MEEGRAYDTALPVIVQYEEDYFHPHGGPPGLQNKKELGLIQGFAGKLKAQQIRALLHANGVRYVTIDPLVRATGKPPKDDGDSGSSWDTVSTGGNPYAETIGLEQTFNRGGEEVSNAIGYNGKGVTVAIFDSGFMSHADISSGAIHDSVDFTTGVPLINQGTTDGYGHGTHVTGLISGTGSASVGEITGLAPQSDLLHVKVLDDTGQGLTSNVIAAIDWVIQNKYNYNVRVANFSLGHPAFESYETDPLCQAVRRMVDAGIVAVVSAGNLGRTENHPEIWGGITSPGTEPSAITVGAANTQGTVTHSDDTIMSFSSRGYTLPDNLFKPDLVAPGNRVPAANAAGSYIELTYPELMVDDDYVRLSGSSMATAFVSGTAALILDANPDLDPNVVKTILLMTATKMTGPHMLEQGNGFLNAHTAVKLAEKLWPDTPITDLNPGWILNGENGPEEVWAGGAFVWDNRIFYSDLVTADSPLWGEGVIWSDNLFGPDSVIWADSFFGPGSVIWSDFFDGVIWADFFDSVIWADFFDSVIWADFFDSVIWADNLFDPDSVIWSDFFDSVVWADSVIWAEEPSDSGILGDD